MGVETAINGVAEGWRVAVRLGKTAVGELVRVGVAAGDVGVGTGSDGVMGGTSVGATVGLAT